MVRNNPNSFVIFDNKENRPYHLGRNRNTILMLLNEFENFLHNSEEVIFEEVKKGDE